MELATVGLRLSGLIFCFVLECWDEVALDARDPVIIILARKFKILETFVFTVTHEVFV